MFGYKWLGLKGRKYMQISAIQSHSAGHANAKQTKNVQTLAKLDKSNSATDSFSREKINTTSFKAGLGPAVGGLIVGCIGAVAAVATAGAAVPFLAAYYGGLAAGGVVGAVAGAVVEDKLGK